MEVVCFTSDKGNWLLPGFCNQWAKYGDGIPVKIAGFTPPDMDLPDGFEFISIGNFEDYPANRWTNAVRLFLQNHVKGNFLLMLEDYWLTRPINTRLLRMAEKLMGTMPIARFDVTTDVMYHEGHFEIGSVGCYDLVELNLLDSEYTFSLQAGIFNREVFLNCIPDDLSPWDVELTYNEAVRKYLIKRGLKVYGFRQWPVRYQIMVRAGMLEKYGDWMFPARELSEEDKLELALKFDYCLGV